MEDDIIPHPACLEYTFRPKVVETKWNAIGVDPYPELTLDMRTPRPSVQSWDYHLHRWHMARSHRQQEAMRKMEKEDT